MAPPNADTPESSQASRAATASDATDNSNGPIDPAGLLGIGTSPNKPTTEEETFHNMDMRKMMQIIAAGIDAMSKSHTYVNEPSPFANVSLVFDGEDVTQFLKEIDKRASFY